MDSDADTLSLASTVLIISVLAIIFTAPLGAILMLRLAPIWLKHSPTNDANGRTATDNQGREIGENNSSNVENLNTIESAGNDNLDRNQKSV